MADPRPYRGGYPSPVEQGKEHKLVLEVEAGLNGSLVVQSKGEPILFRPGVNPLPKAVTEDLGEA
eukprot:5200320-Alexandrium_andersonii.AAC.1